MFKNKMIKTLGTLMLLVFLCFGQIAAVPHNNIEFTAYSTNMINPSLSWNTFIGGAGGSDFGSNIFVDEAGDIYIVGTSSPYNIGGGTYTDPTWEVPNRAFGGGDSDAFVAKLNSSGALIWSTFLGGVGSDDAGGIVVDGNGSLYVAGSSTSNWGNPIHPHSNSGSEGFIVKLDTSGVLVWNTFLGGNSGDLSGIDLDSNGSVYLIGTSTDNWIITNVPLNLHNGNLDVYVAKMTSSGSLSWYTFLGGVDRDSSSDIVVGNNGNIFVGGTSDATWGNPVRPFSNGYWNAFVSKLDSSGTPIWNTFLGAGRDHGDGIAVDENENVYITGVSSSTWGNPVRAFEYEPPFSTNSFAAKLNSDGTLIYNTFLGNGNDGSNGIALDKNDYVYVIGTSCNSWGNPFRLFSVCPDPFIAKLDSSGNLITNGFFGGNSNDHGVKVYASGDGNVYLIGASEEGWGNPIRSFSKDFIGYTTEEDAFIAKLAMPSAYTIYVTNINNSGNGSLRQAIADATNGAIITFDPSLSGQTIHLASELVVDKSITIDGSNLTSPITVSGDADSDGGGDVQIIEVSSTGNLTIKNLAFTKGHTSSSTQSGGIENLGQLTVIDGKFSYNSSGQGGAIRNSGTLIADKSIFVCNTAIEGGAILNNLGATATIRNSNFTENSGAGGAVGNVGTLTIENSAFSNNSSALGGGALVNSFNGITKIYKSTFTGNSTQENGGAIYNLEGVMEIYQSTFTNNSAKQGGAIIAGMLPYGNNTTTLISESVISNNQASLGGGGIEFDSGASMTIDKTTISGNTATAAGGIANISGNLLTITNSTISNNTATQSPGPGGIISLNSPVTIKNSTITGNNLTAIYVQGNAIISNTTIAGNPGYGLEVFNFSLNITNSIIANNNFDCSLLNGAILSVNQNNLIETNNGCGISASAADPLLGPLTNNGGLTQTMALLPNSPAIGTGDNATCETVDQRGITRPQGSHCDIGAYEYPDVAPFVSTIALASTSPTSASSVDFTVTFSEPVTGVDADGSDFDLFTTGVSSASIIAVTPVSASVYAVTVNTGSGNGTIRLDVPSSASITDLASNPLGGLPYTTGEAYTISKSAPSGPTDITVKIGGVVQGTGPYHMVPDTSQALTYVLDGGPVEFSSTNGVAIIASLNQWRRRPSTKVGWTGVSQSMALPVELVTNTYVMPRYDYTSPNALYNTLLLANVDTVPRDITVTIGGVEMDTYTIDPSKSRFVNYPGVAGGPVVVSSVPGAKIIASLYELIRDPSASGWNGQSEMMGLPWSQLSDKYLIPMYFGASNPNTLQPSLYIANADTIPTTVNVFIAGVFRGKYDLAPGTGTVVRYILDGGPVEISSDNGAKIIASLNQWRRRPSTKVGWTGVSQSMALPVGLVTNKYVLPRYDYTSPNALYNTLLLANVDTVPRDITVAISGVEMGTYTINPSKSQFVNYPGVVGGPVVVSGSPGAKIIASLYELIRDPILPGWNGQSEMMGLPWSQLSNSYLLPIYFGASNPNTLRPSLYIAVP